MNKQIAELASKSGFDVGIHNGLILGNFSDMHKLDKFAELIVRECVAQIEIEKGNPYRNMGDENRYGIGACVESIRRIKEQFGIE
jgi:hypothetical protein